MPKRKVFGKHKLGSGDITIITSTHCNCEQCVGTIGEVVVIRKTDPKYADGYPMRIWSPRTGFHIWVMGR